jgi:hypothetical protein
MNLEEFVEDKYYSLLKMNNKFEKSTKKENIKYQKCKFELISELVSKLFKYKNSKDTFRNISNLIILSLTAFDNEYPVDIYFGLNKKNVNVVNYEYQNILKQEFEPQIQYNTYFNLKD